jgi:non-specific serine/threonine protein kinase
MRSRGISISSFWPATTWTKRNVLVHKFVCRGTIEDRIDQLIESKPQLAEDFLGAGGEINMTEMSDRELLSLVALDLDAAMKEGATS